MYRLQGLCCGLPLSTKDYYDGKNPEYFPGQGLTAFEIMGKDLYPLQEGTVVKCTFLCGKDRRGIGKRPETRDRSGSNPACVVTCPVKASISGIWRIPQ